MVSNRSLEYSHSDKYKIYLFYACQNVAEAKKATPTPTKIEQKYNFLVEKSQ